MRHTELNDPSIAVASFGRGKWSFFEFLQQREQHLRQLQRQLAELDCWGAKGGFGLKNTRVPIHETHIYVCNTIDERPALAPRGVIWLPTAPVVGKPTYPVVLDVVESAKVFAPSELIAIAGTALAPSWEELRLHGLTAADASRPRWDDVQRGDDDVVERFLLTAISRAIASLGPGYGVILHGVHRYDYASTVFTARLLREARLTGFHVAINAPTSIVSDPRFRDWLLGAQIVKGRRRTEKRSNSSDQSTCLLALCPHGAPTTLLEKFDGNRRAAWALCDGPGGERWAFLHPNACRSIRLELSPTSQRKLYAQLFDAWEPKGWGYLRRAGHAIAARDLVRTLAQHTPYNYGLAEIGRDFLYGQFVCLSRSMGERSEDLSCALHAMIGTARLAARVRRTGGQRAALQYYRRALHLASDPVLKADLIYAIANLYAHKRQPAALAQARRWYERGYEVLDRISNKEDKVYVEVRLANGLALVEYREGHNEEALALEEHARAIALSAKEDHPYIERWATPVINKNTAKLLEKRFANLTGAKRLLEENITSDEPFVREHASIELARLHYDEKNYDAVVNVLSPIYDGKQPADLDERTELFGRLMFSFALSLVGEMTRTHRQLRRLTYLLHSLDTPNGNMLLASLIKLTDEYGVALTSE